MEKTLYHNINYKNVSTLESMLLNEISSRGVIVFGVQEAKRLTGFGRTRVHNLLASLAKKGLVLKLLRNKYCLKESAFNSRFAVATSTFVPSYVSFWSALSFYGFTEQQVSAVQVASPKQFKGVELEEIVVQPITVKPKAFFGYVEKDGFSIASKEKALVDSAMNFENAGGFDEFVRCLHNAWAELNRSVFVEFLLKSNNKSANSRIGYLVEELNLALSKELLGKIYTVRSTGFVKLNPPKNKTNAYNKKWNIIINDSIELEKVL